MVNICGKCDYYKRDGYCERLRVHAQVSDRICEFYVKRRGKNAGSGD